MMDAEASVIVRRRRQAWELQETRMEIINLAVKLVKSEATLAELVIVVGRYEKIRGADGI